MNEARFIELLATYGAELSRWPEDERGAAEALLEVASHRLKDIWESERVFDHLLALEKDAPASISLETRVIASVPPPKRKTVGIGLFGRLSPPKWAAGGVIAASLALGFAAGYAAEPVNPSGLAPQILALSEAGSAAEVLLSAESGIE